MCVNIVWQREMYDDVTSSVSSVCLYYAAVCSLLTRYTWTSMSGFVVYKRESLLLGPGSGAEYCDQPVCLCVCLSVCP